MLGRLALDAVDGECVLHLMRDVLGRLIRNEYLAIRVDAIVASDAVLLGLEDGKSSFTPVNLRTFSYSMFCPRFLPVLLSTSFDCTCRLAFTVLGCDACNVSVYSFT